MVMIMSKNKEIKITGEFIEDPNATKEEIDNIFKQIIKILSTP